MNEVATEDAPIAGADAKGSYYCPGCGRRYETPGVCIGHDESPHEEIKVERVKPESKSGGESKQRKPQTRRKSAGRKTTASTTGE